MAELAIRTVLSAPAPEAGIEMNLTTRMSTRFPERLDFAAGDKSSLEPGPSRARYFPRDMLLLTTTARESLSRAVVVNSNMSRGK